MRNNMTITAEDCKLAIKTSKTINPLLTYATDWQQLNEYNANNGDNVRVFNSISMDKSVYVIERVYGLEVTTTKPDIQWSFEIQPYDQWEDWETILFRVYDQDYFNTHGHYENEFLANQIKNLIPGSIEVSEGMFKNPNFTDHNFIEMMEYENFINMTPDLGEKPERPEPTEEGCGADECCGGSCSSMVSVEDDDSDLVEDFWYYEIITDEADGEYINITSKAYWEKYGCLDDRNTSDALEQALPPGFSELAESTFDYNGNMAAAKAALDATGKFQEFCFGFY
jgi:hypothetical protein